MHRMVVSTYTEHACARQREKLGSVVLTSVVLGVPLAGGSGGWRGACLCHCLGQLCPATHRPAEGAGTTLAGNPSLLAPCPLPPPSQLVPSSLRLQPQPAPRPAPSPPPTPCLARPPARPRARYNNSGVALRAGAWCARRLAATHDPAIPVSQERPVLLITDNITYRRKVVAGRFGPLVGTFNVTPTHFKAHRGQIAAEGGALPQQRQRQRRQLLLQELLLGPGAGLLGDDARRRPEGSNMSAAAGSPTRTPLPLARRLAHSSSSSAAAASAAAASNAEGAATAAALPTSAEWDAHLTTLAELYVLARATCLVRCRSGFSEMAYVWGWPACSSKLDWCIDEHSQQKRSRAASAPAGAGAGAGGGGGGGDGDGEGEGAEEEGAAADGGMVGEGAGGGGEGGEGAGGEGAGAIEAAAGQADGAGAVGEAAGA